MKPAAGVAVAVVTAAAATTASVLAIRRWKNAPDPCLDGGGQPLALTGEPFKVETNDGAVLDGIVAGAPDSSASAGTVVLSHCWTGSRSVWVPVAVRLVEQGCRVVLYDQRGHGASTLGTSTPSVARIGADLAAVLEAVDARDAVVAGHSMGGMAVQALAVDHPFVVAERVRSLVLVSTAAAQIVGWPLAGAGGLTLGNPFVERVLRGPAGPALLRTTVGRSPRHGHLVATRDTFVATSPDVRLAFFRAIRAMDLRSGLASVPVPVSVVNGSRDLLILPRRARALAGAVPGARLVEVPGAGHMLPFEEPDLVAGLILDAARGGQP